MSTTTPTTKTTSAKAETEDTSIKSNLNSVSDGCNLATFKRHITTCLQRWRHPSSRKLGKKSSEHQQQLQQEQEEIKCPCQQSSGVKWFRKYKRKELFASFSSSASTNISFVQRTTIYCKTLNAKLHRVLSTGSTTRHRSSSTIDDLVEEEGPHHSYQHPTHQSGCEVEILAKLLSKTLVETADSSTSTTTTCSRSLENIYTQHRRGSNDSAYHSVQDRFEFCFESSISSTTTTTGIESVDAMTITDLTFLEIRDEYPDLDSEIRSILTTRAQDGATISDIRGKYTK